MTIQAVVAEPLFSGFIASGLEAVGSEVRHVLVNLIGGGLYANKTNVGYAIWPGPNLGTISAPSFKASNGTTDALGQFVLDTSGTFFPGDEVILAVHVAAGAVGGADDEWGIGAVTISAT